MASFKKVLGYLLAKWFEYINKVVWVFGVQSQMGLFEKATRIKHQSSAYLGVQQEVDWSPEMR
jgi:hypothetical protein